MLLADARPSASGRDAASAKLASPFGLAGGARGAAGRHGLGQSGAGSAPDRRLFVTRAPEAAEPAAPSTAPERAAGVAAANAEAAEISSADARWVFAARVASSIEGGRAAVLRPEKRQRLIAQAKGLGLREFDANLIVAIVQDSARGGLGSLGRATADRLTLIRPTQSSRASGARAGIGMLVLATVCLATAIAFIAGSWLLGV